MYLINPEEDLQTRLASLSRKIEAMEIGRVNMIKSSGPSSSFCSICGGSDHDPQGCPTISAFQDMVTDQANVVNNYQRPPAPPLGNSYNPNWRNHPNFSWRNGPQINAPNAPQGPPQNNFFGAHNNTPYVPPQKRSSMEDALNAFMNTQAQMNQSLFQANQELKSLELRLNSTLGRNALFSLN